MNSKELIGVTIFVVDDNREELKILVHYLSNLEIDVVPLRSGEELLKLLKERLADMILLDIMMPEGIDGFETCRKLKTNDTTKDIPVLFMSALTDTFDKVEGFNVGAVDYITKPIEIEELISRVHTHLSISRLQKELFEMNMHLEEKVLMRTEELRNANKQLRIEIEGHKQTEESFKQSEKKYKELQDNVPVGVFRSTAEGEFISVNKVMVKMLKYNSSDELIQTHNNSIYANIDDHNKILDQANKNHVVHDFQAQVKCKDGSIFWVSISIKMIFDEYTKKKYYDGIIVDITEPKKVKEELVKAKEKAEENEEKLKNAQQIAQLGHWELDLINNKLVWSDEIYRIFGLELQEFEATYEAFLNNIHPDDRNMVNEAYSNSLKNKEPYQIEHRLLLQSGELKYVVEKCISEFDKQGKPIRSIGTVQDITSRKISEVKLEEQALFINTLLNNLKVGIIACDKDGVLTYFNEATREFYGLPQGSIPSKDWEKHYKLFLPDESRELHTDEIPLHKALKREQFNNIEIMIIPQKGKIYTLSAAGRPLLDSNGKIRGAVVSMYDITELKKNQKEIRKLSTVVEQSVNTIVITDTEGNIEYVNPKFSEVTGYAANEVLGQNPRILSAGTQPKEHYALLWQTITAGKSWKGEFHNKKKNGEFIWEQATITPLVNDEGEITNYMSIKEDITARILAERELNIQNQEYAALNEEYKAQNEELLAAKEKAEESNRLKTAFLQNMSHEVRTPMNSICGFSSMLNREDLSQDKRNSFISIIQDSSQQLLSILTDILIISSIETKQEKVNIQKVCINTIVVDLFSIFNQQAINQNISLQTTQPLNDNQSEIYTDKAKITQVLTNLIANALKYTDEGFIEFGYNLNTDIEPPKMEFYVKDSGIGINPELHEKIFERFTQANKSIHVNYGGTGLGLSISKGFIELLGGKIWVQSVLEKGSTFYFTIPYKPVVEIDKTATSIKQNKNLKTVLIAEDEEYNFLLIKELLKDLNLKILHTRDGKETVMLCKDNSNIDLILMDVKMPIMNGHEAAKKIKKIRPELMIIAQSAYALEHEIKKYGGIFDDYITKPINGKILMEKIMKHTDANIN